MTLFGNIRGLFSSKKAGAKSDWSINNKVISIGAFIVAIIAVLFGAFSILSLLSDKNKAYLTLISEQQVVSQQMTLAALEASEGNLSVFADLETDKRRFEQILGVFESGDAGLGLPALSADYETEYAKLQSVWNSYSKDVDTVLGSEESIKIVTDSVASVRELLPELILVSEALIDGLVEAKAPPQNVAIAAHQRLLVNRLDDSLQQILREPEQIGVAVSQLSRDIDLIKSRQLAMLEGKASLGVDKFTGAGVMASLAEFRDLFDVAKTELKPLLDYFSALSNTFEAARSMQSLNVDMLDASKTLSSAIEHKDDQLQKLTFAGYGIGLLALLSLVVLTAVVVRASRQSLAESQSQNDRNQRAILRLLDEMESLQYGDLSTHTTVTEDITGAIADSVNYSIDALRDLVQTINKTAVQVSSSVQKTHSTTSQLEQASNAQAAQISTASASITQISKSMLNVSEKATDSAEVARKSVDIAHTGGETVRHTIEGMETIREQIQETSKRIKRLGESSQEIGDIVNLITEISDQTNILALNAAIQAAMAGEAGRGFAVVADEVQRLAERTGNATKQIEALVKTIQADTNEATMSMERSTANVVKGAKLAEDAGSALDRIEQVSKNLARRILEISDATKSQAADSIKITQTMDVIQQITSKTAEGSVEASHSIGELSQMVKAMHASVDGFKLPEANSLGSTAVYGADEFTAEDTAVFSMDGFVSEGAASGVDEFVSEDTLYSMGEFAAEVDQFAESPAEDKLVYDMETFTIEDVVYDMDEFAAEVDQFVESSPEDAAVYDTDEFAAEVEKFAS